MFKKYFKLELELSCLYVDKFWKRLYLKIILKFKKL